MTAFSRMSRGSVLAFACVALLGACSDDPNPSADTKANLAATKFAVNKVGPSLEIDGCTVNVHRISTATTDILNSFTMAVASCPTAKVTATEQNCGKNCQANTVMVQPITATPSALAHPAPRDLATQASISNLRAEIAKLSAELDQLEKRAAR